MGELHIETEAVLTVIQEQVIPTRSYLKHIIKGNIENEKCRMYNSVNESIQHIISGCTYLVPKEHLQRHNNVARIIHQTICNSKGLSDQVQPYFK